MVVTWSWRFFWHLFGILDEIIKTRFGTAGDFDGRIDVFLDALHGWVRALTNVLGKLCHFAEFFGVRSKKIVDPRFERSYNFWG